MPKSGGGLRGLILVVALSGACKNEPAATSPKSVRAVTYNVLYRNQKIDETLNLMAQWEADFLCLQEVTHPFMAGFAEKLGARYPHQLVFEDPRSWGIALLSRHPLKEGELLPQWPHHSPYIYAKARLPGGQIQLTCHHLMPPQHQTHTGKGLLPRIFENETIRRRQVDGALKKVESTDLPTLMMGDFNAWQSNPNLSAIEGAGFRHVCKGENAQCYATFPGPDWLTPPLVIIDHIYAKGLDLRAAWTVPTGHSDHYPLVADFDWVQMGP